MTSWLLRVSCALLLGLASLATQAVPRFEDVRQAYTSSEALLLDRRGEPIERLRVDASVRRGDWVPLAAISPALRHALVLSEDRRFYEHSGVDWRAVGAAAWANLWNTRTRGASTLTMQLAGLVDDDWRHTTGGRSVTQKLGQALMATRLEQGWRKDQILEAYLNLVPFRGELVGIDALARTLFGKAPHGLDDVESAIAAALVRAPNAPAAQVSRRACGVLHAMQAEATDCTALDLQATAALARRAWPAGEGIAPHVARRLLAGQPGGARITSTLDAGLQRLALQTLQQHVKELSGQHVEDGAVVVLDNASGEVLAWVGSTGDLSDAAQVDMAASRRQPGSTLKPFLYAEAIAEKRLTAASLLHDSPAHLQTASGLYIPQNYDRQFKGWVSVRTALASSLNVPAVRAGAMVTPDTLARQLDALGLNLREPGGYYGYSLALGSAEVTLADLTNAYRALANLGRVAPIAFTPGPRPRATQALDTGAAFIVGDILSDPEARAATFGTDSLLATRFWSAVKTGTSKDMRDNWAVGFSRRYTVGVWVGNAGGAAMWDVSGTSGAAPVWAALMKQLHARTPSRPPAPPPGVVRAAVRFGERLEAARSEWFLQGTQQPLFAIDTEAVGARPDWAGGLKDIKNATVPARITAPQDGVILALDPDIPPARQRLQLVAEAGGAPASSLRWWIGAREVGRGAQADWLPWPGRHVLQLRDAQDRVLDERRLEVRGALPKPGARPPA